MSNKSDKSLLEELDSFLIDNVAQPALDFCVDRFGANKKSVVYVACIIDLLLEGYFAINLPFRPLFDVSIFWVLLLCFHMRFMLIRAWLCEDKDGFVPKNRLQAWPLRALFTCAFILGFLHRALFLGVNLLDDTHLATHIKLTFWGLGMLLPLLFSACTRKPRAEVKNTVGTRVVFQGS